MDNGTAAGDLVPGVRKIAVLRANGIGDFIFALPALAALRTAYPAAELVLLGKAWHAEFLADRPAPVDRVIVIPPTRGVGAADETAEDAVVQDTFFARMQAERFDLALQCHGGGKHSNPFVRRLGARVTAGTTTPDAVPLDRSYPYVYWQNEVLRYLETVQLVGAQPVTVVPRLAVTAADLRESLDVVPETDKPLVALNPGASDPERRWPPAGFAAVGDALAEEGARVVITGADCDRPLGAHIHQGMHAPLEDLTGRLTLGGLAGLLSRCAVVVSNDTGPLHLAAAVGAATVGIYWCFNLVNAGPVETARHWPLISWRTTCPVCHADRVGRSCAHHPSFVADIQSDEVITAARALFHRRADSWQS